MTEQGWSIRDLFYAKKNTIFWRDTAGNSVAVKIAQLVRLSGQQTRRIWFFLPAHGASEIIS